MIGMYGILEEIIIILEELNVRYIR